MEITYSIPGLAKLQKAVALLPGQLASRNAIAIDTSLGLVKSSLESKIATGPGHFGFHARDRLFTRVAAGQRVVGVLYTTAPQLRWSEGGTKPHLIRRWVDTGRGYAVRQIIHHPGEKPTHLFRRTLAAMKSSIRGVFVGATQQIVDDLARSVK